jgi:type IV secretion system protein VirB6
MVARMSACPSAVTQLGVVRDVLGAVDCNVQTYAAAGYQAFTGPGSFFPAALTALLTIYVAVVGYRLLFAVGGSKLSDAPLIALEVGGILALTLNWGAFQTLVFNFAANAPLEVARVISQPMVKSSRSPAADPINNLQAVYDELTADGIAFGKKADPAALPSRGGDAAASDMLWRASTALLASTAGLLAVASIATGVLTAVGPVFIALFLFEATRGFCIGWVRALVAAMLAPMVCWITTSLMLVVVAPWVDELARQREGQMLSLDTAQSAASIVLVFAASQAVLVVAGLIVAGGFRPGRRSDRAQDAPVAASIARSEVELLQTQSRTETLTRSLRRSLLTDMREGAGPLGLAVVTANDRPPSHEDERPTRLGESYRRGVMTRDRRRVGVGGRK